MRCIRLTAAVAALALTAACGDAAFERGASDGIELQTAEMPPVHDVAAQRAPVEPGAAEEDLGTAARFGLPASSPQAVDTGAVLPLGMLIRTGSAHIRVDSLEAATARARGMVEAAGGMIANVELQSGDREIRRASLQVRIPADRFDALVNGLAPLGRVERVNVQAQDVGEEFTDVAARLENARRLEERLLELLRTRTGNLTDVLAAERELARVREQSERLEGRLRYLRSQVAVSTFLIHLYEPAPLVGGQPGTNPIAEALRQSWRNFVEVVAFLIAALGVVVPVGLLAMAGWWIFRALRARRPRRPPGPRPVEPDDEAQAAD